MSKKPIVRTTTRVPATYEDVHEDWTAEKIRECFGDDPSCIVVPLLNKVEALERQRDALADALREYHESHSAPYPPYSAGKEAQDAWADRIDKSETAARALLVELEGKG